MFVEGAFEVTSWTQKPITDLEGTVKITTARIAQHFSGETEGSDTGELTGISGSGSAAANRGGTGSYRLELEGYVRGATVVRSALSRSLK